MRCNWKVICGVSFGLALAGAAGGDTYELDWFTFDGGGGMWASGGDYELSGTIGQPDAGVTLTGGDFELTGGFWVVTLAVAPPVCPGDCNCDGNVGFADIDFFVAAIPNNEAAWRALFLPPGPTCSFGNCDVDGDGNVGFADIDPFVAKIPSACP
jgi:hypothetical protein